LERLHYALLMAASLPTVQFLIAGALSGVGVRGRVTRNAVIQGELIEWTFRKKFWRGWRRRRSARSWSRARLTAKCEFGRLHVARKPRHHDEWDPPIAPYDPFGPGTGVSGDVDFVSGDETGVSGDADA
jgi:hypothetical protein